MAKISITALDNDETNYTALVTLTQTKTIEGEQLPIPIGEATVTFPKHTEMADIKTRIIDTAKAIMTSHQDAADKRKDLEEVDWPEIT